MVKGNGGVPVDPVRALVESVRERREEMLDQLEAVRGQLRAIEAEVRRLSRIIQVAEGPAPGKPGRQPAKKKVNESGLSLTRQREGLAIIRDQFGDAQFTTRHFADAAGWPLPRTQTLMQKLREREIVRKTGRSATGAVTYALLPDADETRLAV